MRFPHHFGLQWGSRMHCHFVLDGQITLSIPRPSPRSSILIGDVMVTSVISLPDEVHVVHCVLRCGGFQTRSVSHLFASDQQDLCTIGFGVTADIFFGNNRGWAAPSFRILPSSSTSDSRDPKVDAAAGAEFASYQRCLAKHRSTHLFTLIATEKMELHRRPDLSGTPGHKNVVIVINGPLLSEAQAPDEDRLLRSQSVTRHHRVLGLTRRCQSHAHSQFPGHLELVTHLAKDGPEEASMPSYQSVLPRSVACLSGGFDAVFATRLIEIIEELSSLIQNQVPRTPIMLDPLLKHALHNMLRLSVHQETTTCQHVPASTKLRATHCFREESRRYFKSPTTVRLVESVWSGSRCRGSWSHRHTGCPTGWADPTQAWSRPSSRSQVSAFFKENISTRMTQASVSSADSRELTGGLRPDLRAVHLRFLLIAPLGMLVAAPLINVGVHHHFLIELLTLVAWAGWSLRWGP